MSKPPARVKEAVANFTSRGPFTVIPPSPNETSFIFKWGVRVEYIDEQGHVTRRWACLADEECRTNGRNLIKMSGKTSSATETEQTAKRKRDETIDVLKSSPLFSRNPGRLNLLLETLRIINNNLPLRLGEYEESKLKEALVVKEEMRTTINADRVKACIVDLYASTKNEIMEYLEDNKENYPTFTMVADFWTCKTTGDKYLGIRVYLVDSEWQFKSVLLGTRKFNPAYGDREGGIQKPFKAWLMHILSDFGLTKKNFYGATSDSGSDVKCMLLKKLKLYWEWCFAHLVHAATKTSCGKNGTASAEANPGMVDLITRLKKTIYQVKSVMTTGNLFEELCKTKTEGASTRLVSYSASRFLSLTVAIKRVLDKWNAIEAWYEERRCQAIRARETPPEFPLANRKNDLVHVLSVLTPLAKIKRMCQAERPVQVEVLMNLYMARIDDLCSEKPVPHYLATDDKPKWIASSDLTPLAVKTREVLRDAIDDRFFNRYYDPAKLKECRYIFEMQQELHPIYKNSAAASLNRAVVQCCRQHNILTSEGLDNLKKVQDKVRNNLLELLRMVADPDERESSQPVARLSRVEAMFAPRRNRQQVARRHNRLAEDELERWLEDPVGIARNEDGTPAESVLQFWQKLEHRGDYRIIPKAVRVLFAIPSSSCQIERDFSVSGNMVTTKRTSLAEHNVDICSFLNRNREFVNLLQCEEIPKSEHHMHIPTSFVFDVDSDMDMEDIMSEEILAQFIPSTELYDEEEKSAS